MHRQVPRGIPHSPRPDDLASTATSRLMSWVGGKRDSWRQTRQRPRRTEQDGVRWRSRRERFRPWGTRTAQHRAARVPPPRRRVRTS
ncbi:hypothetical protein FM106_15485 [Brachybacterium faecium]|nr:hypothetical protein FM106_15485 [Brachybacterium faecium]